MSAKNRPGAASHLPDVIARMATDADFTTRVRDHPDQVAHEYALTDEERATIVNLAASPPQAPESIGSYGIPHEGPSRLGTRTSRSAIGGAGLSALFRAVHQVEQTNSDTPDAGSAARAPTPQPDTAHSDQPTSDVATEQFRRAPMPATGPDAAGPDIDAASAQHTDSLEMKPMPTDPHSTDSAGDPSDASMSAQAHRAPTAVSQPDSPGHASRAPAPAAPQDATAHATRAPVYVTDPTDTTAHRVPTATTAAATSPTPPDTGGPHDTGDPTPQGVGGSISGAGFGAAGVGGNFGGVMGLPPELGGSHSLLPEATPMAEPSSVPQDAASQDAAPADAGSPSVAPDDGDAGRASP